ncbi:MAG TPA: flotillin domain-containing protein [Polyangiaceae bacterium]|nr:flotillin domain-containing protein [Polyangiaceae bacterium]
MSGIDTNMIVIGGSIVGGLVVLLTIFTVLSRFYRRCGADEALVRTGSGGNKVVIGGGVLVYPILHQLLRVSLRSVKLSVERSAKNALVTADKIKANVTTELYIKVEPIAEDVLAAARSFGERNLDEHVIADLIEGKLTDALRSVAANQTFMALHANRKQFAERIQEVLSEELKKNGLTLENVSITAFAMLPVKDLDPQDVFDAEGLRAITESVQTNREMTNRIQREKDNQIQAQNVDARKKQLGMEQDQKQAEADQARKVAEYSAIQAAETAKAVYVQEQMRDLASLEKQRAVETARIEQEKAVAVAMASKQRAEREAMIEAEKGQQAAEIAKQRVIEAANIEKEKTVQTAEIDRQKVIEANTIDKEKAVEVARIGKQIAITQSEEQEARAAAAKALAVAEEEKAKQTIITVETTAKAEREKAMQVIAAQAEAEVKKALAEAAAAQKRIEAEAKAVAAEKEAAATVLLANAMAQRGEAEAQVRRKLLDAENAMSSRVVMRDIVLKALEVGPEIARELMAPAKAITEIKVLQTSGMGGAMNGNGANGAPALGVMSPVLKTILEAGAAYPLLRELMSFAQVDKTKLSDTARTALADLGTELANVVKPDSVPPVLEPEPVTNRPGHTIEVKEASHDNAE